MTNLVLEHHLVSRRHLNLLVFLSLFSLFPLLSTLPCSLSLSPLYWMPSSFYDLWVSKHYMVAPCHRTQTYTHSHIKLKLQTQIHNHTYQKKNTILDSLLGSITSFLGCLIIQFLDKLPWILWRFLLLLLESFTRLLIENTNITQSIIKLRVWLTSTLKTFVNRYFRKILISILWKI